MAGFWRAAHPRTLARATCRGKDLDGVGDLLAHPVPGATLQPEPPREPRIGYKRQMLRPELLLVSFGFMAACQHAATSPRGPAEAVLDRYRAALEDAMHQERDAPDPMATAFRVTRAELLPQRPILHEQAIYLLKQLERRPMPSTTTFRSLVTETNSALLAQVFDRKALEALLANPNTPADELWALLVSCWNPVRLPGVLLSLLEARTYGAAEMGRRGIIRSFAPASLYRTSDDWQAPALVLEGGRELFILRLVYDDKLLVYVPQQVEWYAKR